MGTLLRRAVSDITLESLGDFISGNQPQMDGLSFQPEVIRIPLFILILIYILHMYTHGYSIMNFEAANIITFVEYLSLAMEREMTLNP